MWAEPRLHLCPARREGVVLLMAFGALYSHPGTASWQSLKLVSLTRLQACRESQQKYNFLYPQMRKDNGECLTGQEGGSGYNGSWLSAGRPVACVQRPKMPAVAIQMGCNQR